jgi:tetratricopeptide (TPR) repeat protein
LKPKLEIATFLLFIFCADASASEPRSSVGNEFGAPGGTSKLSKPSKPPKTSSPFIPENADPRAAQFVKKGIAEVGNDEYDAALADLNRGYAIDPHVANANFYDQRRAALAGERRFKEALPDASRAIQLDPSKGFYFNSRGQLYAQLNQNELAVKDFIAAESLLPRHKWTPIELGHCYDRLGQFDKSVAAYSKALALDSSFVKAYEFRASAYEKLGKKELAAKDRKSALSLSNGWASDLLDFDQVKSKK